jgi:hypothetical protein
MGAQQSKGTVKLCMPKHHIIKIYRGSRSRAPWILNPAFDEDESEAELKSAGFWVVTSCSWDRPDITEEHITHLQNRSLACHLLLLGFHFNPEDCTLHSHCHENLKSNMVAELLKRLSSQSKFWLHASSVITVHQLKILISTNIPLSYILRQIMNVPLICKMLSTDFVWA